MTKRNTQINNSWPLDKIKQNNNPTKYFLQLLDLKNDSNMTRIYSVLKDSTFINNTTC